MESPKEKQLGAPKSLTPRVATRPRFEACKDEELAKLNAEELRAAYVKLREFMARLIPTDQRAMDHMIKARALQIASEEGWTEQQGYMATITGWFPRGMHQGDLSL